MLEKQNNAFEKIKMVVMDLDGTLLNQDKVISDRAKQQIKNCLLVGLKVVFATGRPYKYAKSLAREIDSKINIISFNGCHVEVEGRVLANQPFQPWELDNIAKSVQGFQGEIYFKREDEIFAYGPENSIFIYPETLMKTQFIQDKSRFLELSQEKILKILLYSPLEDEVEFLRKVLSETGKYTWTNYGNKGFEICPIERNKGIALRQVMKFYQLEKGEIMAIGDGENDVILFEESGLKIAMKNGKEELKMMADVITKSNHDDGVALILEEMTGYLLERKEKSSHE